jgi:hypothetical protein
LDVKVYVASMSLMPSTTSPVVVTAVLGSVDLVAEILGFLCEPTELLSSSQVSKSFYSAVLVSNTLWREACRRTWSTKWGFEERWCRAKMDSDGEHEHEDEHERSKGSWWRDRHLWEEQDAKRDNITVEELHSLVFDFRFWMMGFLRPDSAVRSGLRWTSSKDFRFGRRVLPSIRAHHQPPPPTNNLHYNWPSSERGIICGHPSRESDLEWFLDRDGKGIQWGRLPDLWPKGQIVRLESWGWEIRNPNVVLRAMDRTANGDEKGSALLWRDYLDNLMYHRVEMSIGQQPAMIEVPQAFWDYTAAAASGQNPSLI